MVTPPLSFSVVIEWENAKLSELARTRLMLSTLAAQIHALDPSQWLRPEIVILYDSMAISPQLIQDTLDATFGEAPPVSSLKLLPTTGKRYYELKNYGATHVQSDVLVFLDSDVIPETGWLETLLEAIKQPGVDVVGGNTYIRPDTLFTKAFALFWFFPMRTQSNALVPSKHFFANNVAFRKAVFNSHPFPCHKKFRGQCVDLAQQLCEQGHGLFLHQGARVDHPPPNGVYHFIIRALCAGYDQVMIAPDYHVRPSVRTALHHFRTQARDARKRIQAHRREVDLGPLSALCAQGIAMAYFGCMFVGECITLASPGFIPRHCPI
jgi:hypothetical protein